MNSMLKTCVDDEIFSLMPAAQAAQQYKVLLKRLYPGQSVYMSGTDLKRLLARDGNIVVFRVKGGTIVSTAQATLIPVEPTWQAVFSNVITLETVGRQGHGRVVMQKLIELARAHWGSARPVNLVLTNNKDKGNSEFYTDNGWIEIPTTLYGYTG